MGHGQYNSLGEYCGPHTASSVFLILRLCDQSCTKVKDYQEGSGGVKDEVSRGRLVREGNPALGICVRT